MMVYRYTITRVCDGKQVIGEEDFDGWDSHNLRWFWDEGNNGCDCNRAIIWNRGTGDDELVECSEDRFVVQLDIPGEE